MAFSSILYLWSKWNIRSFVILSLFLQIFLILFAPLRKKTANKRIIFLLWLAYLMADWIAAFGIGLISHNQGNSSAHVAEVDRALRAFWASFLLLHLGGPDTITAFSLEDSSLWQRHLLNLMFQVGAVIYVFVQIFPSDRSLVIPTMLVFLAGVIKNVERTLALNLSSLPRLREWMLSQQESLDNEGDEFAIKLLNPLDGYSHVDEEAKLAESIVVKHAYYFFQISKVFLTDLIFTYRQRKISTQYFHKVSAVDALRVISVELHFIYKVLHTKALTIRSKWSYVFRFIAFIDIVMAFVLFNRLKKHQLPELDVKITYLLIFGGIALDVLAMLILVFSDWTIAKIQWHKTGLSKLNSFLYHLVSATDDLRKARFAKCEAEPNNEVYAVLDTPLLFRRWSESIYACNLLSESFKKSPRKMYERDWHWGNIVFSTICSFPFFMVEKTLSCFHQAVISIAGGCGPMKMDGKRSVIANTRYVSTNPFILKLWIFIFREVRRKSIYTIDARGASDKDRTKEIYEARGDWFLRTLPSKANHRRPDDSDTESIHEATDNEFPQNILEKFEFIMFSVEIVTYYESIIGWHLATEIWYNKEDPPLKNDEREFSKILSDYMLYLLLNQSNLVSAVAGIAQIRLAGMLWILHDKFHTKNVKSLCEAILSHDINGSPEGYETRSLNLVIGLARELGEIGEGKWKVMAGVWVEIVSYAAGHIKGEAHAQVLSKGGELLTFVWMLMIHFGLFSRGEWAPHLIFRE